MKDIPRIIWIILALTASTVLLCAEDIPALLMVPDHLPRQVEFSKERGDLRADYRRFKADADKFTALTAENQDDSVYQQLEQRRAEYIAKAIDFNRRLTSAINEEWLKTELKNGKHGTAAAVIGQCFIIREDGSEIPIESGGPLPLTGNLHMATRAESRLQILLPDDTVFSLGSNADIVLDKFVYDPDEDKASISARVVRGLFRFVTGKIARRKPEDMQVRLNVAIIGIRGTDFEVMAEEDGSWIRLYAGQLEVTELSGAKGIMIGDRQQVKISPEGKISEPTSIGKDESPTLTLERPVG